VAVNAIIYQSTKLLSLSIAFGFAYVLAAIAGVIWLVIGYERHGFLPGWPSLVVLLLASTGLILTAIGILGLYLGSVFVQVRAHPVYAVQEHCNLAEPPH